MGMPMATPLDDTVQAPSDAQMSVTPLLIDGVIAELLQVYDPVLKVIVAPSVALLIALLTLACVDPAVHVHVRPDPLHAAKEIDGRRIDKTATINSIMALHPAT